MGEERGGWMASTGKEEEELSEPRAQLFLGL